MTVTINGSTGIDKVQDGSIVQADLAAGVAGNGPAFSAYQSSAQTLSNSTYTKVNFQTEEFDTAGCFDTSTSRFTPNVAGHYFVNGACNYQASTVNETFVVVYKNGSPYKWGTDVTATNTYGLTGSALVYCNGTTDYVEFYTYQSSGGNKNLNAVQSQTYFQGYMVRAA